MLESDPHAPDPPPGQLAGESLPDPPAARGLWNVFLFTWVLLSVGVAGLFSYLSVELQRIEFSTRILICLEEVPTLLWFFWFVAKHSWFGKPFRNAPCDSQSLPWEWWLAVGTIAVALGFKTHTAYTLMRDESTALANAVMANGEITQIQRKIRKGAFIYVYQGWFLDRNGVRHEFHHYANERHQRGWLQPLSQQTRQALKNGKTPAPVAIAYDPDLPARNWVDGVEDDQWRLYKFLGYLVIIQIVATFNFAVGLAIHIRSYKVIPWWYDLHMVLPLMVESVCFAFAGVMVGVLNPLVDLAFGN